jgi:hypothetical protein
MVQAYFSYLDIDIYVVTPDNINNLSELYAEISGDLRGK